MRLVLDTNVIISALLWNGLPARLYDLCHGAHTDIFCSVPMIVELSNVLSRRKFSRGVASSGLSVGGLVELYTRIAISVTPIPILGVAPDPDDDVIIGTAVAARADLLVTGDHPLLSVQQYQGVRIVSVQEALRALGAS